MGHVPDDVLPVALHRPTRHRTVLPHGCPPDAKVTAPHFAGDPEQPSPDAQSVSLPHGAPDPPGFWHVDGPVELGQTSGGAHSESAWHAAPAPPGAVHRLVDWEQKRPSAHSSVAVAQLAPAPPRTTAVHTPPG